MCVKCLVTLKIGNQNQDLFPSRMSPRPKKSCVILLQDGYFPLQTNLQTLYVCYRSDQDFGAVLEG